MKRKNKAGKTQSESGWQKYRHQILAAIIASTCTAVLVPYSDSVTSAVKDLSASIRAKGQDIFSPMSDDKILGVSLMFYLPQQDERNHHAEGLSATIWPTQCKAPGGKSIVRTFDDHNIDSASTRTIVSINCRASGRVQVKLTPQSGTQQVLYDGIPGDAEQLTYPGIPGSYSAGILTFHWLDMKEPEGPWVPVNKCLADNSCNAAT